jgi:aldose 1-epimerase
MTTPMPHDDDTPRVVDLAGPDGLRLRLLDRGATWWSLQVPVRGESQPREVLLGAATPTIHVTNQAYLGATVGRVANRIGGASIERDGRRWPLQPQPGSRHQLHGGPDGYDRRRWTLLRATPDSACLGLQSPPLDQGFPGALSVEVEVWLRGGGVVEQQFRASCTEPTPVCLTNHAYFNLDGATTDVRAHRLQVDASHWVPVDDELIPLGPLQPVDGTAFDFRTLRAIGSLADGRYDHGLLLRPAPQPLQQAAATLQSADGRLRMRLSTTLPALQLYTGQHLGGQPARDGGLLPPHAGVALEPEWLPDSVHHPEWPQPDCWLQPGQRWLHTLRLQFDSPADTP